MLRKISFTYVVLVALIVAGTFPSCEETLPQRIEPARFLKASLHVQPNSIVEVFIDSVAPSYPITVTNSSGKIELRLRSFFNEVLEETPSFRGDVDVWLTSQPTVRTKIQLTEVDVDYPYIEPGGLLSVIPGDSVTMSKQWHHIADNGRGFWNFVQLRGRSAGRGFYFESAPVRYSAVATMRVFENVPAERTETYEFELVYHVYVRYPPVAPD
jgi:hypothetical protein